MASASIKLPPYMDITISELKGPKEPIEVTVTGEFPDWLSGSLYRNGSGIYRVNQTTWKHAFDGLAVLHRWTMADGKVTYLSVTLDSEHYKKCVKFDRLVGGNFGTSFPDPCKSIFKRFFSHFVPMPPDKSDNTAVSLLQRGDRLLALTETSVINEINPKTLQKSNQIDVQGSFVIHSGTAHPHVDKDGSCIYYGTHYGYNKMYKFIRIPPAKKGESIFKGAKMLSSIPSRWKGKISYTHSFGITENYIVHFEQPLLIDGFKLLTLHMKNASFADAMTTNKEDPIHIVVISKETGKKMAATYLAPHGFVFHFVNCYEEAGYIICDVSLYKDAAIVKELYLESLCSETQTIHSNPYFARFILPLDLPQGSKGENLVKMENSRATAILTDQVKPAPVVQVTCDYLFDEEYMFELPRINYTYNATKYRYAYGTSVYNKNKRRTSHARHFSNKSSLHQEWSEAARRHVCLTSIPHDELAVVFRSFAETRKHTLMKFDLNEKTVLEWPCDENHIPGEPVFVAGPDSKAEDDGVVLCPIVATSTEHSSFLLVLDAATMTEIARATTPADTKMNYSFHGLFIGCSGTLP